MVPGCALKGQPSWPVGSTRNPAQGRATPPPGRSGTLGERPPPPAPPLLRSSPGPAMQSRGRIAGARGAGNFRLVPVPQGAAPLRVALPWAGLICPFGAHPGGFNYQLSIIRVPGLIIHHTPAEAGCHRGVSHTPSGRPDRGERSSDSRVRTGAYAIRPYAPRIDGTQGGL